MRKAEQKKRAYLTMEHPKRSSSFVEAYVQALCALTGLELLLHGMLYLLESEFSGWNPGLRSYGRLQLLLLVSIVVFELVIPACGKYKSVCQVALEIGYPLAFALVAWCRRKALTGSGKMLFNDYLVYWNRQFGTVYESYPKESVTKEGMLVFLIAVVFFICVMLRYVSGVRMFLLLPDLAALFAGLLVNARPQWRGLASFFVGTVLVFAAPGTKTGEMRAISQRREDKTHPAALGQLFSFSVVAVSSMLFVSVSGYVFSGVADHIPEKTPQFYVLQQNIEEAVQNRVNKLSSLGITFQKDRAHVDNQTPEYSGETVLELEIPEKPRNNLYLKNFDSGTYRNNTWVDDDRSFEQAAKKQGYDSQHIGMLLQQQVYEMLQAESSVTSAEYQDVLASSDFQAEVTPIPFTVKYERKHLPDAFFPYFSDLSDAPDNLWVEGDALIRKKRSLQEAEGKFFNADGNMTFDVYSIGRNIQETKKAKAYEWYSGYVQQQYRRKKTQVPSIQRFLRENREGLNDYIYGAEHYKEGNDFFADQMVQNQMKEWKLLYGEKMDEQEQERLAVNSCRSELARCVKELLAETASYNLYLNSIPKGTNTIDYFLETGHEGYCMHFATAGALLLQELGVPARYASGYVVKESDYHDKKGTYVAEVPDYNAHAWVEIYMERIGWIPVEMTPGYDESIAKIPTDPGLRESLKEKHRKKTQEQSQTAQQEQASETELLAETQLPEETPQEQTSEKAVSKEDGTNGRGSFDRTSVALIAGALLCFLAAAFWILRQQRAYRMRLLTELREKKNRQAVKRMNRRIYYGLRQKSIGIKTDAQYLQKLQEVYPQVGEEVWACYLAIVQKAVFSMEPMTSKEAHFCYEVYRAVRRKK